MDNRTFIVTLEHPVPNFPHLTYTHSVEGIGPDEQFVRKFMTKLYPNMTIVSIKEGQIEMGTNESFD